jgi:AraC-like DNA-binding protein
MQQFPAGRLLNNLGVTLPQRSQRQFILDGRKWELPTFENAEEFVKRLVSKDLVNRDAEIAAALNEEPRAFSRRTSQRRFLRVVGMPFNVMRQIERARFAVNLLREGVSIADAVWQCGYYDHAHPTRSLRRSIGVAPSKVADPNVQLSFLYKTDRTAVLGAILLTAYLGGSVALRQFFAASLPRPRLESSHHIATFQLQVYVASPSGLFQSQATPVACVVVPVVAGNT